jgi:hypothetical protein
MVTATRYDPTDNEMIAEAYLYEAEEGCQDMGGIYRQ